MNEIKEEGILTDNSEEKETCQQQIPEANTDCPSEEEKSAEPIAEVSFNYEELAKEDILALREEFPELDGIEDITELHDPLRYAALRDLGFSPREAYIATSKRERGYDNRAHLKSAVPRFAGLPRGAMPESELARARMIFDGLSDSEIRKLYKKVTV